MRPDAPPAKCRRQTRLPSVHHNWPQMTYANFSARCRNPGCSARCKVQCLRCGVNLCLTADRNCFVTCIKMHTQNLPVTGVQHLTMHLLGSNDAYLDTNSEEEAPADPCNCNLHRLSWSFISPGSDICSEVCGWLNTHPPPPHINLLLRLICTVS